MVQTERLICSKERPYDKDNPDHIDKFWAHPDAKHIDSYETKIAPMVEYEYDVFECPICGVIFEKEIAQ